MKIRSFIFIFLLNLVLVSTAIAQQAGGGDEGAIPGGNAEANAATGTASVINGRGGSANSGPSVQADEFTGAATYNIQIGVPPSRGGLEPNLTLNYNSYSKNRNGWVGYGWDLSLGSITRTSDTGSINFDTGQSFQAEFAGQSESLVLVQEEVRPEDFGLQVANGAQVSQYAAKYEGSYNIYLHIFETVRVAIGRSVIRDYGWVVLDKSGKRYVFGDTEASRDERYRWQEQQIFPLIGRWLLKEVVDPNGNRMSIRYGDDLLPDTVSYQDIEIEFVKQDRRNYFPIFRESFLSPIEVSQALDSIIIRSHGERLQKYQFSYSDPWSYSGITQLIGVQQFGKNDNTSLAPFQFGYHAEGILKFSAQSYDKQASRQGPRDEVHKGYLNKRSELADMDGDGLVDQVVSFKDSDVIHVYFNDGNDFVDRGARSLWRDPNDFCNDTWKCQGLLRQEKMRNDVPRTWLFMMDMNGDHLPDRVRQDKQGDEKGFLIALNTGSGWAQPIFWKDPNQGGDGGRLSRGSSILDINGDGLPDRVLGSREHERFNVHLNTGSGFAENPIEWHDPYSINHGDPENWQEPFDASGHFYLYDEGGRTKVAIRDFNGDGLPDRIWKEEFFKVDEEVTQDRQCPQCPLEEHRKKVLKSLGKGFMVALNRNGEGWAQPGKCENADGEHQELDLESCQRFNNQDILAFLDPIKDFDDDKKNIGTMNSSLFLYRNTVGRCGFKSIVCLF